MLVLQSNYGQPYTDSCNERGFAEMDSVDCRRDAASLSLTLPPQAAVAGEPVAFAKVDATHFVGSSTDLEMAIDGQNMSPSGWTLGDQFDQTQSIIFSTPKR